MALFSILFYIFVMFIAFAEFIIFLLLYIIITPFDPTGRVLHELSRAWTKMFFRLGPGWKLDVEGLENIKKGEKYIVAVNHQSMMDVPLMYILPLNFKWVAKKEVYRVPLFGWVMRLHRDIGIDRASKKSGLKLISEGKRWIDKGLSITIFPEGTRTKTGDLGRFKEGAFLLAKSNEVAVLPCVIDGTKSVLNGWRLRANHTFKLRVLPPIPVERVQECSAKELALEVHDAAERVYEEIRSRE